MEFRILGPVEVWANGERLALGRGKQQALLALLLVNANRVVPRERLIDELWGAAPPATAEAALLNYVSRLRRLVGEGRLASRGPGYQLRIAADELDAARFERLTREGRYEEALALWRGPALADVSSQPFAQPEAARLEELRLNTLEQRIERELDRGGHADVVGELEALTKEHPLRERFRAQLIVALYRAGRQADALRIYRDGRARLVEELGIEPSAELQRLERAVLTQDPSLAAPSVPPSGEPPVSPGTVTFLFTDVEDSTGLVRQLGDEYAELLATHNRILGDAFTAHGGSPVDRQGDALFFSFRRARDALTAAVAVQRAIAEVRWPQGLAVRIRIGIHTGEPRIAESGYHGLDVVRAARISAAAHGGQIVVSSASASLLGDEPPPGVTLRDLGEHRLRGFARAESLFQVVAEGLDPEFPPLRTARAEKLEIAGREDELAAAAGEAVLRPGQRRKLWLRRRRIALAAILACAAVLVAVAAVAGLPFDSPPDSRVSRPLTGLVAHSVGLIDPATNQLVAQVPLGRSVRHVAVGDDTVWVAKLAEQIVLRIDPQTRRAVASFGIGESPTGLAVTKHSVWVVTIRATLLDLDPITGRPLKRLPLKRDRAPTASDLEWPPRLAIHAGVIWVSSGKTVWQVNASTGEVAARYRLGDVATGIAANEDGVWVADFSDTLTRIEPATHAILARTLLPADPVGVAVGAGSVWVTGPADNAVWRVDPLTNRVSRIIEAGYRPWSIAAAADGVWVGSWLDRTVRRIDPATNKVVATVGIGNAPVDLAATGEAVWVAAAGRIPEWPEPAVTR